MTNEEYKNAYAEGYAHALADVANRKYRERLRLVVVEGDHLEQNAELEDSNDLMDKGRAELAKELLKPTNKKG